MRRTSTVIRFFGFLTLIAAASCGLVAKEKGQPADNPRTVEVVTLGTDSLAERIAYTGEVVGRTEIRVFSPIPERIVALPIREGQRVAKGEVLAVVRAQSLDEGVRAAAGGLDAARAQRDSMLDQAERLRRLKATGAITDSQLLTVENQLTSSQAQVRQLEATVGQAQQRRGDAIVRAPIEGVLGQVFLKEGDFAAPQLPICTIVEMDVVRLEARVPETDLPKLAEGQSVTYQLFGSSDEPRTAQVTQLSPVLDRMSRTAKLEVEVQNADHALRPGMLIRLSVEVARREGVVVAPSDGLTVTTEHKGDEPLYRAVVVKDGKAQERMVRVGLREGTRTEVLEGLAAGEQLIVRGQHVLVNGESVILTPNEAKAAAPSGKE
ncbi:MAG: efflux RND transporter periplasmic adaptor subunit [Myxococcota bacterium]|jgi:membrane fusion protein (multidrug efflux system)|nr:efflux RND transporter periplasmic adaptor subunit [Myxococcota bacterium]